MACNHLSKIQQFYLGKTVFLTGATGFLGKLILEKVLRTCDVKRVYILLRPKRNKPISDRFQDIINNPIFTTPKKEQPIYLNKLTGIAGDCNLPNLGMSNDDQNIIKNKVNIIFHSAATVNFNEPLKTAANINVRAVRDLMRIAKDMKHLQSFIHISTAYSNCNDIVNNIEEKYYEPHMSSDKLLSITDSLNEEILQTITKKLIGKWSNTYAFTKAMAENVVNTHGHDLPIGIVRPSLVLATYADPIPGYIDNWYGLTTSLLGSAIGLVRITHADIHHVLDLIPADFVVNTIIAASFAVNKQFFGKNETAEGCNGCKLLPIYNCCSSQQKPIPLRTAFELFNRYDKELSTSLYVWYHFHLITKNQLLFEICTILFHKIPAHIGDFAFVCLGRKPTLVEMYNKMEKMLSSVGYFAVRKWTFSNTNLQTLWNELSVEDKTLFNFNIETIDWDKYFPIYIAGLRIYLLKDTTTEGKWKMS